MEFFVELGSGRSKYIAVYPNGLKGYTIVVSETLASGAEPNVTIRGITGDHELERVLLAEGVSPEVIFERLEAVPPHPRTILVAVAASSLLWVLIGIGVMMAIEAL